MREPVRLTSRDNALLLSLRKLAQDPTGYRKAGQVWLEGDHLLRAALARGRALSQVVMTEAAWQQPALREIAQRAARIAVVDAALMKAVTTLESPAPIGALLAVPIDPPALLAGVPSVVLDRLQDAGNVGSVLRSAAAMGIAQVVALSGTAALWSPKVVRAGMGAHFALHLVEQQHEDALGALAVPLVATSSHAKNTLADAALPYPCAFVFGHEGRGVSDALLARCDDTRRIPQPGGEESLNVAAAAAICLYEAARQRG